MLATRTALSTFGKTTGCRSHFSLALLLCCQLTVLVARIDATLELPASELLQHAQELHANEQFLKHGSSNGEHLLAYELPPSVEDDEQQKQYDEDVAELAEAMQADESPKAKQAVIAALPPAAAAALLMQLHNDQQQQQPHLHRTAGMNKLQQHHLHRQPPQQQQHRHCSIEISTKIHGTCQPMKPIGSACISGEYMDVFNMDCM